MTLSLLTLLAAVCLKKRRLMKTTPTISGAGTQDEDDVKVNPNEAYALHAISTAHNTEHTSNAALLPNASAVMTAPNEAYAVVDASTTVITAPNKAYAVVDASTTVITAPNEAYAVVDASTTVITAPNEVYAAVTGPSEDTGDLISSEAYSTATPREVCPTAPNVAYGATTDQARAGDAHQLAYEAVQPQDTLTYDYVTLQ